MRSASCRSLSLVAQRPDRVNARVAYINDDMTANEKQHWDTLFTAAPEPLSVRRVTDPVGMLIYV